jgi:hypothetical protein
MLPHSSEVPLRRKLNVLSQLGEWTRFYTEQPTSPFGERVKELIIYYAGIGHKLHMIPPTITNLAEICLWTEKNLFKSFTDIQRILAKQGYKIKEQFSLKENELFMARDKISDWLSYIGLGKSKTPSYYHSL